VVDGIRLTNELEKYPSLVIMVPWSGLIVGMNSLVLRHFS